MAIGHIMGRRQQQKKHTLCCGFLAQFSNIIIKGLIEYKSPFQVVVQCLHFKKAQSNNKKVLAGHQEKVVPTHQQQSVRVLEYLWGIHACFSVLNSKSICVCVELPSCNQKRIASFDYRSVHVTFKTAVPPIQVTTFQLFVMS